MGDAKIREAAHLRRGVVEGEAGVQLEPIGRGGEFTCTHHPTL